MPSVTGSWGVQEPLGAAGRVALCRCQQSPCLPAARCGSRLSAKRAANNMKSPERVRRLLGHDGADLPVFMAESRYLDIYGELCFVGAKPLVLLSEKKQTPAPKLVFKWKCAEKRMISPSNQFY